MTREKQPMVSHETVLLNLARAVPVHEEVVQLGASHHYPAAWHDVSPGEIDGAVGLLHLGPGRHGEFDLWRNRLVKGAIVLMEGCTPDSEVYCFATDLAARGYLSSPVEARCWSGLGVSTYFGGARPC